jgi:hypothetical protein
MVCDEVFTGILHCRGQALRSCYTRKETQLPLDGETCRALTKTRSREYKLMTAGDVRLGLQVTGFVLSFWLYLWGTKARVPGFRRRDGECLSSLSIGMHTTTGRCHAEQTAAEQKTK